MPSAYKGLGRFHCHKVKLAKSSWRGRAGGSNVCLSGDSPSLARPAHVALVAVSGHAVGVSQPHWPRGRGLEHRACTPLCPAGAPEEGAFPTALGGALIFGLKGVSPRRLPPEPPYWGTDDTGGLLERVAGENASLPCPARGEAGPDGRAGEQPPPRPRALGHTLWAAPWVTVGDGVLTSSRGHARQFIPSAPSWMRVSISSFLLGVV